MNDELKSKLLELGFSEEQVTKLVEQGVTGEAEMSMLSEQEIREITGATVIAAKKAAGEFAPKPTEAEAAATSAASISSILPALPDDSSFLEMLKVGGVLKIDRTNVIAAMHAAIAAQIGLYELPDILMQRMEQYALEQEEPVGDEFYRLQTQLAERRYGEVLAAVGAKGSFVSEKRKRDTLARLNELVWPSLRDFNNQLRSWMESWTQGVANPANMMMAWMSRGTKVMPPGMLDAPDTSILRDQGEAVINHINKAFAGTGIPVSRALAYDAMRIREVLVDPSLPAAVGAPSREAMLKMLGVDVGADFIRLDQNVTRYALAIMELPKVTVGDDELTYFSAMFQLGGQIPWDKLGTGGGLASPALRVGRRSSSRIVGDPDDRD